MDEDIDNYGKEDEEILDGKKKSSSFDKDFKSKIEASKKQVMGKKKETDHVDIEKATDESTIIFDGVLYGQVPQNLLRDPNIKLQAKAAYERIRS